MPLILWAGIALLSCKGSKEGYQCCLQTFKGNEVSQESFTAFLRQQMDSLGIPGLSIALINKGEVVYNQNLGYANLDTREELDQHSIFEAASLSKPVFAYKDLPIPGKAMIIWRVSLPKTPIETWGNSVICYMNL